MEDSLRDNGRKSTAGNIAQIAIFTALTFALTLFSRANAVGSRRYSESSLEFTAKDLCLPHSHKLGYIVKRFSRINQKLLGVPHPAKIKVAVKGKARSRLERLAKSALAISRITRDVVNLYILAVVLVNVLENALYTF